MPKALIIDYKYCTGCHACEVSCANERGLDPQGEAWGIKVAEFGPMKAGDHWMWNYVPVPSDLCDLCAERTEAGQKPACVLHCLGACMDIVKVEEVSEKLAELGKTAVCFIP